MSERDGVPSSKGREAEHVSSSPKDRTELLHRESRQVLKICASTFGLRGALADFGTAMASLA
jgi:hypothetical protein